jgi:hypothetical protein
MADALMALGELPYEPSITVNSGHGLQCWWLFAKPWMFKDEKDRQIASNLSIALHDLTAKTFGQHGWTVDATHDLARVMRLPGTMNHKGKPEPVNVIATSAFRWSRQDIASLPVPSRHHPSTDVAHEPVVVGQLYLSEDMNPPEIKLSLLMECHPKFAASWRGLRTDFTDQSASVYDMSIASIAAQAGFSDQEIAALLVAHRRRNGLDLKLRQDYYQRTIGKVRA